MATEGWDQARVAGSTHVRAYFSDTDPMGVVYNGKYLTWMEIGRTELLRDRGMAYAEVEAKGISLPVTEARMRVRLPARYDDRIRIETRIGPVRTREITFFYRMYRGDRLLVEGRTTHVPVRKRSGRATRMPEWLLDTIR
jgi:acyl-CoA thioester hydrolase